MVITNKIKMDLSRKENLRTMDAVQGDAYTRNLEIHLYDNGEKWVIPDDVEVVIAYKSKTGNGAYSALPDNKQAYEIIDNVVTVTIAPQAFAVAGDVFVSVLFLDSSENQIATFGLEFNVHENAAVGAGTPKDYFNLRQWVSAGPLIVTIKKNEDGSFQLADNSPGHDKILVAVDEGREVICRAGADVLPLQFVTNGQKIRFQSFKREEYKCVEIDTDNSVSFEKAQLAYKADLDGYAKSSELNDYAKTAELKSYAKKTDLNGYAKTEDLVEYAKTSDVRNPLYVVFTVSSGVCTADKSFDDIKSAYKEERTIIGVKAPMVMRLQYLTEKTIRFQSTNEYRYDYVEMIKTTNSDGEIITAIDYRTDYYAQGAASADEKYFDIDYNGVISLKREYKADGSKAASLPERITIPDNIGGEQVSGFQAGMFSNHQRIKEVVLPKFVTKIPDEMFHKAIYLEKVENTEQIESIGDNAFSWTRIRDIHLPNLTSAGVSAFENCSCLITVDLGNIPSINNRLFAYCENLSEVLGGSNVTTIGERAFYSTRRLKSLSFLANLEPTNDDETPTVGEKAFFSSRCDFEGVYDTLVAKGCTFGTYATYKQYGGADYWSGTTFTPCKTHLNSMFHQKNPAWADTVITPDILDDGVPSTYGKTGCAFVSLAEIYSAFEDVSLSSPVEFANILDSKGLLGADYNFRSREGWCAIANALGYNAVILSNATDDPDVYDPLTKDELQQIYDALADGALVYRSTAATNADGGHATLWYGVNSDGEFLFSDTSMHCDEIGIYENHKSAWHTYNNGSQKCGAIIVTKGGKT